MKKAGKVIALCTASFAFGFMGAFLYQIINKPDGYLYMNLEDKSLYANLMNDPDSYKPGSKLLFIYRKGI